MPQSFSKLIFNLVPYEYVLYKTEYSILVTNRKFINFCYLFSLIKNSKSYRTVALLVVPATFVTIAVLLVKGLNSNQRGLDILLDIQWETLWKLDVSLLTVLIFTLNIIIIIKVLNYPKKFKSIISN